MEDNEEIDLQRYLQIGLRYWWLLLAGPLLAALVATIVVWNETPFYEASTRVLVQQSGSSQDLGLSEALARSYTELVRTTPILETSIEELGLDITPNQLRPLISSGMVANTQIMEIHARYTEAEAAGAIANTVTEVFIDYVLQQRLAEIARLQAAAQAQGVADVGSLINNQLQATNSLTVIEPAIVPNDPLRGSGPVILISSAVLGLLAAALAAFVIHHIRDRVESPEVLESRFGLVPLGSVEMWTPKEVSAGSLVMTADPASRFAEQFRHVRASLQFTAGPSSAKSIVVTSAGPGEGKSTVIGNIAAALAQDGKRVILVDADLRRPSLHHIFGLANTKGLSNYLALSETTLDEVLRPSGIPGLGIITSGPHPPNPSELLGSARAGALLEELAGHADYVLVDTPPVLAVADPVLLAAQAEGTLLVADTMHTKTGAFAVMLQHLQRANAHILGVVLDKARRRRFGSSYGYYYYYDYSSSHTNGNRPHSTSWLRGRQRWLRRRLPEGLRRFVGGEKARSR